jgi:Tfp pilus assembly protein PilZ
LPDPPEERDALPNEVTVDDERRRFRRIQAQIYCRPAGMKLLQHRAPIDLSMGGLRIYSDERFPIGDALRLEVFLPDAVPVTFTAEVVWITALPAGAPAKFDVGLKFTEVDPTGMRLLAKVLGPAESE